MGSIVVVDSARILSAIRATKGHLGHAETRLGLPTSWLSHHILRTPSLRTSVAGLLRALEEKTGSTIAAAIKKQDGRLREAAEVLGMTPSQLSYRIRTIPGLKETVAEILQACRARVPRETRRLVKKHRGNLSAAAREAGVTNSSFFARVEKAGLLPLVASVRPRINIRKEKERLLELIVQHRGAIHKVAAELGIAKNTLRARLVKHHLVAVADAHRAEHNLTGVRTELPFGRDFVRRRAELMRRINFANWNLSKVTRALKISAATFYKNLRILRIDPATERKERAQSRVSQIIDALRKSRGNVLKAADLMGWTERRLLAWCKEHEIQPPTFR